MTNILTYSGTEQELTPEQIGLLIKLDLIYWCSEEDCNQYHLYHQYTWDDIDAALA